MNSIFLSTLTSHQLVSDEFSKKERLINELSLDELSAEALTRRLDQIKSVASAW